MEQGMLNDSGSGSATQQIRESASTVRDEISKAAGAAKQATQEQLSDLGEMGSRQLDRVSEYVRERPITALAMGIAFGYVVAAISRR